MGMAGAVVTFVLLLDPATGVPWVFRFLFIEALALSRRELTGGGSESAGVSMP
jgi:hypothetical protein